MISVGFLNDESLRYSGKPGFENAEEPLSGFHGQVEKPGVEAMAQRARYSRA